MKTAAIDAGLSCENGDGIRNGIENREVGQAIAVKIGQGYGDGRGGSSTLMRFV